jgi:hypothetical protein
MNERPFKLDMGFLESLRRLARTPPPKKPQKSEDSLDFRAASEDKGQSRSKADRDAT